MNRAHARSRAATRVLAALLALALAATGCKPPPHAGMVKWSELAGAPVAVADERIAYGADSLQFGELRIPKGEGPFPVAVLIHGGCWLSAYDLEHVSQASAALARDGVAVWTIEYRRLGDPGGGWPGTFEDIALGVDFVARLAERFPRLDSTRVVLVGHSAGGQLALWAASRASEHGPEGASGESAPQRPSLLLRGVVSLAGITDLKVYGALPGSCNTSVARLLGGTPEEVPDRYAAASPMERLPIGVPVRLVHGAQDPIVPPAQSRDFEARDRAAGGDTALRVVEGAGHFDLVAPHAPAWQAVVEAVRELTGSR